MLLGDMQGPIRVGRGQGVPKNRRRQPGELTGEYAVGNTDLIIVKKGRSAWYVRKKQKENEETLGKKKKMQRGIRALVPSKGGRPGNQPVPCVWTEPPPGRWFRWPGQWPSRVAKG